jgi:hypothetical protein
MLIDSSFNLFLEVVFATRNAYAIFGYDAGQLEGLRLRELFPRETFLAADYNSMTRGNLAAFQNNKALLQEDAETGLIQLHARVANTRDGGSIPVEVSLQRLRLARSNYDKRFMVFQFNECLGAGEKNRGGEAKHTFFLTPENIETVRYLYHREGASNTYSQLVCLW